MLSEKYRPRSIHECVLSHLEPHEAKLLLEASHSSKVPNLLLWGPPGMGKTTVARILADPERFSVDKFNGSLIGKSGVEAIHARIRNVPLFYPHRCILLDEADGITPDAQKALRALIEEYSERVSWIMTANDRTAISDALQSRMINICFSVPELAKRREYAKSIAERCLHIFDLEKLPKPELSELIELVEQNRFDIRQTLNQIEVRYRRPLVA